MPLTHSDALIRATAKAAFWQSYESWPSVFDGLVQRVDSNADQENYPWLGYAPKMREMVGSKVAKPIPSFDWTIKNKKWEATVAIDYETRKYGKLGAVQAVLGNLGQKARNFQQSLLSDLVINGATATCYDSQYFFDTDHTDPGAVYTTNQSNYLTSAATAALPTDTEMYTACAAMIDALHGFKDNEGDPVMPAMGAKLVLMVPPLYKTVAERIATQSQITGPVGNVLQGAFEVRVNPWLTAPTTSDGRCYMFNASGARKPFIYQVAEDVTLEDNLGGDYEFMTKDAYFSSFGYFNVGYGDWRYVCGYKFT
jgi:phage major head subunit gpT-like protein